jgi:hypothetical protein
MLPTPLTAAVVAVVAILGTLFAGTEAMSLFLTPLPVERRAAKGGSLANAAFPSIGSHYYLNTNEPSATADLEWHGFGVGNAGRRQRKGFDIPGQVAASGAGSTGNSLLVEMGAWHHGELPA